MSKDFLEMAREAEQKADKEFKRWKTQRIVQVLISLTIGVTGMCAVGMYSNWTVAVGVFMMIWGNNNPKEED